MVRPVLRLIIFLTVLCLGLSPLGSGAPGKGQAPAVYFEATDPEGDDYGPGSYLYPQNIAFQPYEGLFDLLKFRVSGDEQNLYFDLQIKRISNPWNAPEGFIHPVIHIYLDTARGGKTEPLYAELGVNFPPQYGWEYCLEGVGWESSRLTYLKPDGGLESTTVLAGYLPEHHLIRLAVPVELIGRPRKDWKYYVLIGSYDGFGPGFLRAVRKEPGDWVFGGGAEGAPLVLDLLAPAKGRYAQERQLSFPRKDGQPVVVYPINCEKGFPWGFLLPALLLLGVGFLLAKRVKIFGFWLKNKAQEE